MAVGQFPNLFENSPLDAAVRRIESLTPDSRQLWGRMSVSQMLAHLCVQYEMVYETKHRKPNPLMRWVLRKFVKDRVIGPVPYPKGSPTAPAFIIKESRDFHTERERLINYMRRAAADGPAYYEGRESLSFGPLTAVEWNALFSKHIDHHLRQFGV